MELVTSSENENPPLSYMTLSYQWSSNPGLMLLTSNIEQFCYGKLIRDLPQSLRHSVSVARRFAIRCHWIDALCIVQDLQEDWERESAKMRLLYSNSSCNIAASASGDPSGGLFRLRDLEAIRPGLV
jgi:Heterokaryon incompatibility protein (HET)